MKEYNILGSIWGPAFLGNYHAPSSKKALLRAGNGIVWESALMSDEFSLRSLGHHSLHTLLKGQSHKNDMFAFLLKAQRASTN